MSAQRLWIKNPRAVFTANSQDASAGVVIEGAVIRELIPAGGEPSLPCDAVFDARDLVLLPGLINTHHHFYQTLTRALSGAQDANLFNWLKYL